MNQYFSILRANGGKFVLPFVDAAQMREVDRIAVEDFHLGILQMMENAGRNLATLAIRWLENAHGPLAKKKVVVAAGTGGNGGGGLCAARHLHNHGVEVAYVLTKPAEDLRGAAKVQQQILAAAGLHPVSADEEIVSGADLILDALIGYSLKGAPRAHTETLISQILMSGKPVISLDIASGVDVTSGTSPGVYIQAAQTLTLALPKPGLMNPASGTVFLADIGIPPEAYFPLGIHSVPFFEGQAILPLHLEPGSLQK